MDLMSETPKPDEQVDYEFSRLTYYELIQKGLEMLETSKNLATDSEHPRAIEVFTGLLKGIADINGSLVDLQTKHKKNAIEKEGPKVIGSTSYTEEDPKEVVFHGTPADLLDKLEKEEA